MLYCVSPMARNIRDLLSLICLPLLLFVIIMWARSYFVIDRYIYRSSDGEDCRLRSDCGHVTYFWTTPIFPNTPLPTRWTAAYLPTCDVLIKVWESVGFHHEYEATSPDLVGRVIVRSLTFIPYWFLAILTAAAPAWRLWDYTRQRRMIPD